MRNWGAPRDTPHGSSSLPCVSRPDHVSMSRLKSTRNKKHQPKTSDGSHACCLCQKNRDAKKQWGRSDAARHGGQRPWDLQMKWRGLQVLSSHFGILGVTPSCLSPHCVPPKRNERRPSATSGTVPVAWLARLNLDPGGLVAPPRCPTFDRAGRLRPAWSTV